MTKEIHKILFEIKKEIGHTIAARGQGKYGMYAPLEDVLALLNPHFEKHSILMTQEPAHFDSHPLLITKFQHLPTGDIIAFHQILSPEAPGPQKLGAAETYARRRGLMTFFGLATEDDPDAKPEQPTIQSIAHSKAPSPSRAPKGNHTGIANKVIRCGKKFAGMKYGDCDLSELQNYAQWLQRTSQEQGKEMNDYAIEFCDDLLKLERESSGFAPMDGVPF